MERNFLFLSLAVLIILSHFASRNPDMFNFFKKEPGNMVMLVGLGNPGDKYAGHRHNVGFITVDRIAEDYRLGAFRSKFQGLISEGSIAGQKVLLLKPQAYMNESGKAVGVAAKFFKIPPENIIVFHDELDLKPGQIRVRKGGGNAGHNGLKSIQAHLGTPDFWRVRIGIGHPGDKNRVSSYVLNDFSREEKPVFDRLIAALSDHVGLLVEGREQGYMSKVAMDIQP